MEIPMEKTTSTRINLKHAFRNSESKLSRNEGGSGSSVYQSGPEGKRRIISVLGDGDIVGEMGLIDGLPRSATVTALEDCTISVLSPEVFNSLAQHNPQALMPILKVLSTRLRATLKLVDDIQAGNVDKKSPIEDSI